MQFEFFNNIEQGKIFKKLKFFQLLQNWNWWVEYLQTLKKISSSARNKFFPFLLYWLKSNHNSLLPARTNYNGQFYFSYEIDSFKVKNLLMAVQL